MNEVLERMSMTGIVPVVVIENSERAVPTAQSMLFGGVDVMEITLRTKAGLESIRKVAKECSDVIVGAGTVLTLDQCKECVNGGAKFIVSPGFNRSIIEWCTKNGVVVIPGCVTPTEITEALEFGLTVLKFFPANIYGGLAAMKALAGPFRDVKFIPTGGVSEQNLEEFINAPFIHAVGGSWICKKEDIDSGNFDKIAALCNDARQIILGFEFGHLGINTNCADESIAVCRELNKAFGLSIKEGNSSNFSSTSIEVMKGGAQGTHGHIAIKTNNINRAMDYLARKCFVIDMSSAKYKNDKMIAVYLSEEIGGFSVHLLQK